MNLARLIHQVERTRKPAEKGSVGVRSGEPAATSGTLCRSFAEPFRALLRTVQQVPVESDQRPKRVAGQLPAYNFRLCRACEVGAS